MEKNYIIPPVDIYETADKYVLVLDMPGAQKDGIEIHCEGETLTVSAKNRGIEKDWKPLVTEFSMADYRRDFTIGGKINRDKIEARYDNGILTVELEKSEQVKPRKIDVKVA